jgi:hypothetical protein
LLTCDVESDMDSNPEQPRATVGADVPRHLADALDQSADDIRHGRVEDARAALARLECRLDDRLACKRAATGPAKG